MDFFTDEPQGLISMVGFCIISSLVDLLDINASSYEGTSGCQGERAHWRLGLAFWRSKLAGKKSTQVESSSKECSLHDSRDQKETSEQK